MPDVSFRISPENRIDFGGFESWSNGTSVAPDGWAMTGTAGSVSREATEIKHGTYSMKIISGASATYAARYIYDFTQQKSIWHNGQEVSPLNYFPGRTVSFGCWVKCSSASKARIYVDDGVSAVTNSSYHTGDGTWQFLEVEHQVNDNAKQLKLGCEVASATVTAYFDSAIFTEGDLIWTDFRGSNIWVREDDFNGQVTYNVGSFEVPRREGVKITDSITQNRKIRLSVQIHGSTISEARTIFDSIVKAVSRGRKDIWFEDDRVSKVWLSGLPKLEYKASMRVYLFDLNFVSDNAFIDYLSRFRQKNNISSSPTSFSVVNNGSLYTRPRFYFIPPSGITLSSLTLENLSTGERFSYSNSISPGLSMMIDCEDIQLTVDAVDGLSYHTGDFVSLRPGTNNLRYTGTAGITIITDWMDRYL